VERDGVRHREASALEGVAQRCREADQAQVARAGATKSRAGRESRCRWEAPERCQMACALSYGPRLRRRRFSVRLRTKSVSSLALRRSSRRVATAQLLSAVSAGSRRRRRRGLRAGQDHRRHLTVAAQASQQIGPAEAERCWAQIGEVDVCDRDRTAPARRDPYQPPSGPNTWILGESRGAMGRPTVPRSPKGLHRAARDKCITMTGACSIRPRALIQPRAGACPAAGAIARTPHESASPVRVAAA
jgi:hypothetical protein